MLFNFLLAYSTVSQQFANGHGSFGPNLAVPSQAKFPLAQKSPCLIPFTAQTWREAGPSHLAKAEKPALMLRIVSTSRGTAVFLKTKYFCLETVFCSFHRIAS